METSMSYRIWKTMSTFIHRFYVDISSVAVKHVHEVVDSHCRLSKVVRNIVMAPVCIIVSVVEFMVERRQTPKSPPKLRGMYRRPALRYVFEQKMCRKGAAEGEWVPQNVYNKALRIERSLLRKVSSPSSQQGWTGRRCARRRLGNVSELGARSPTRKAMENPPQCSAKRTSTAFGTNGFAGSCW